MKNKKTMVRIMAGFLAAILLLGLLAMVFPTYASAKSSGVLKGELDALKEEKAALQAEMNNLEGKLVLQVHDELIVECPEQEAETVRQIVTREMESIAQLTVPLIAEAKAGKTWYDAK